METIEFFGAAWCPDCQRAKAWLDQHGIDYDYRDIQIDDEAVKQVEAINGGKRIIPTLHILGKEVANPSNTDLAQLLGVNEVGRVQLYGADWCPDCKRAKGFLDQQGVHFQYIDVDQFDWATAKVEEINKGKRIIPTILVDGEPYTNPDNATLREVLKIEAPDTDTVFDVAIIGAGAAGLTASIYLEREKFSTVLLEQKTVGGNAYLTKEIENYPGFQNISGPDLMDRMRKQAEVYGATVREGVAVEGFGCDDGVFHLKTSDVPVRSKAIIVAVGSTYRRLDIPGEEELIGSGIHFCATCDGPFYRDRRVIVIGGGNSALEEGIYLSEFCKEVTIVHRKPEFSASATYIEKLPTRDNVKTLLNTTPVEFRANDKKQFDALRVRDNDSDEEHTLKADGVFIFIGLVPNTAFLKDSIKLDDRGFIATEPDAVITTAPGVFAAGDCRRHAIAQVAAATGEGVLASYAAKNYLRKRDH